MTAGVRSFLLKAGLLGLLVLGGHLIVALWPMEPTGYLAAVADKQERLRSLPSPKLVFVGGSNLSFGVDSERLERELGRPVANMGLGIYAGFRFMLDSVADGVGPGDFVVVSPEYQFFYGLYDGDEELFDVFEAYPRGARYLHSPRQIYMLGRASLIFAKLKLKRLLLGAFTDSNPDCIYCRGAFNSYGDLTAHLDDVSSDISEMALFRKGRRTTAIDERAVAGLRDFFKTIRARGAQGAVIFPPLPEKHYRENRERVDAVALRLREESGIEILIEPEQGTYPLNLFFDWVYHLNAEGREVRTKDLIELLAPRIGPSPEDS
jgi:hypothetical protein